MIERSLAASANGGDLPVGFTAWNESLVRPLRDGEVHVWRAALSVPLAELSELREVLSPDERSRAARFRFPRDRDRFIAARALLRRLLARYTGERPERLRLTTGPFGKPRLDAQLGGGRVEFNMSHSGAVALYVFAEGRRVGIDVERVLSVAEDDERLSGLWLSAAEVAEMSAMGAVARARAFHSLWTRKEAYVKARGEGLSLAPDRVRVCEDRVSEPGESVRWSLREVPVGPEYAAAVAVEGECEAFTFREGIGPPFAFGPT
jgi:4'-phosphopantetheinyl transferase